MKNKVLIVGGILIILALVSFVVIGGYRASHQAYTGSGIATSTLMLEASPDAELVRIMNDPAFKKDQQLKAETILWNRKKDEETEFNKQNIATEKTRHDQAMADIETHLSDIRKSQTDDSFQ